MKDGRKIKRHCDTPAFYIQKILNNELLKESFFEKNWNNKIYFNVLICLHNDGNEFKPISYEEYIALRWETPDDRYFDIPVDLERSIIITGGFRFASSSRANQFLW